MPEPNFSSWEHFQSVAMKTHNKKVREFFNQDLEDQDITSPEGAVRRACLLEDNDTAAQTIAKMLFFAVDCGWLESLLENVFYGIPKIELQALHRYVPQVTLKFCETYQDMKKARRRNRQRFQISFRWLDQLDSTKVTQADVTSLTNRIKSNFPESYNHYLGLKLIKYYDPLKYDKRLAIPARNESEAMRFYQRFFDVMGVSFDARKMYPADRLISTQREIIRILGEEYIKEDDYPIATVKLKQAIIHLHGKTKKEILFTRHF